MQMGASHNTYKGISVEFNHMKGFRKRLKVFIALVARELAAMRKEINNRVQYGLDDTVKRTKIRTISRPTNLLGLNASIKNSLKNIHSNLEYLRQNMSHINATSNEQA